MASFDIETIENPMKLLKFETIKEEMKVWKEMSHNGTVFQADISPVVDFIGEEAGVDTARKAAEYIIRTTVEFDIRGLGLTDEKKEEIVKNAFLGTPTIVDGTDEIYAEVDERSSTMVGISQAVLSFLNEEERDNTYIRSRAGSLFVKDGKTYTLLDLFERLLGESVFEEFKKFLY